MSKNSIVGRDVYDKRAGLMGRVVKEDGLSLVIEFSNAEGQQTHKTITPATFKRWYKLIDNTEESAEQNNPSGQEELNNSSDNCGGEDSSASEPETSEQVAEEAVSAEPTKKEEQEKGEVGVGSALCKMFMDTVRYCANQDLEFSTTKDSRQQVVKYNGRNVFEVTVCKRRLVVMAHPKSLSPENVKRVTKQYPKEFGWPLSSKFVFTDEGQQPLMKSVIMDGLYYRQIVDKES